MFRTLIFECLASMVVTAAYYDDFHYPKEEPQERSELSIPTLISFGRKSCNLSLGNRTVHAQVHDVVFSGWDVVDIIDVGDWTGVVLEKAFRRWGLLAFLALDASPVLLRKSVGQLENIRQPYFNFTGQDPLYFQRVDGALSDILSERAMNATFDGEVDYNSLAALLAPARDIVELSGAADVVKFVVTHAGRVKLASWSNSTLGNGIVEQVNLRAIPPNHQRVIFDPAFHLSYWPHQFEHSKTGLIGGHLPIANIGSYSPSVGKGFELVAFAPAFRSRHATQFCVDCRHAPRQPNVNYSPRVYIRLREQIGEVFGAFQFFHATNFSLRPATSTEFYVHLFQMHKLYERALVGSMHVKLPESDRRQVDMSVFSLLSAWGNYVGDQTNYGNGLTYWSVARQDNGSLPLNILAVDGGLLEWGMCDVALKHVGFWFDNYVEPDGTINYYTWAADGIMDSIGDIGRLASLYVRAAHLCKNQTWNQRYVPVVKRFGRHMLSLRNASRHEHRPAPACDKGLIKGSPEADWSWGPQGVRNESFYSNNVWILRGMEELGLHLTETLLGQLLLKEAQDFRDDILVSVEACTTYSSKGTPEFLPPYARIGFTPFANMTANRTASYSNFRFYPEALLADVLPRSIQGMLLDWHNQRGGRLAGASRFNGWLDDMPSAGWGYSALTNNRTNDFLALLYGHMATFQSRGSFHSTEQLPFHGEGWYRDAGVIGRVGGEADVDFCIVTQILIARLTKWQLVFDESYRTKKPGGIWLARGAPQRWFRLGAGFSVSDAPTRFGRISYQVDIVRDGMAVYRIQPPADTLSVIWHLKFPGHLRNVACRNCDVHDATATQGVVSIMSTHITKAFEVTATFQFPKTTSMDAQLLFI